MTLLGGDEIHPVWLVITRNPKYYATGETGPLGQAQRERPCNDMLDWCTGLADAGIQSLAETAEIFMRDERSLQRYVQARRKELRDERDKV